jgi:hypothetical protein
MRRLLIPVAVIPAALLSLVCCTAAGSGRVTLSNFVYDRARVETFVTSFPDCELRVGMTTTSFELPLNGTRVIDTPAGSDVCWRRIEPPFAEATPPGVPLTPPWNRAYTASGRIVDARL